MTALAILLLASAGAPADSPGHLGADTLRLATVRAAVAARDPRSVQPALLEEASRLRLANLRAERLPQVALTGQASVQNEVASIPILLPGIDVPRPPHEQSRVQLEADQVIYDGGRLARRADVERARLAEASAGVGVTLYALRDAATEAFFGALLLQSRAAALGLSAEDLAARLALVRARADEGAALHADAAAMEAELIRVRQQLAEAESDRMATLRVLASLTGLDVTTGDVLALPAVAGADESEVDRDARPEFARFAGARSRAEAEGRLARAGALPDVRLFGQAGIGRPSPFEPFDDATNPYAILGVRLRWNAIDWGRARREAEAASIQARIVEADAAAFEAALLRSAEQDRADVQRLRAGAADDDRAVRLREEVLRVAHRQLDEGVLLVADYVDRLTDLEDARLTRDRHRIELAAATARLLSTLGRFPDIAAPNDR